MGQPGITCKHKISQMKRSITKDQLLRMVGDSLLYEKKPFAVSFDLIEFAFGFERKSGLEITLTQLMFPSKTEKSICTVPPSQIIDNVKNGGRNTALRDTMIMERIHFTLLEFYHGYKIQKII